MVVLSHMLLSFRHSPQAFHEVKISSKVVSLLVKLIITVYLSVSWRTVIGQFSKPYSTVWPVKI